MICLPRGVRSRRLDFGHYAAEPECDPQSDKQGFIILEYDLGSLRVPPVVAQAATQAAPARQRSTTGVLGLAQVLRLAGFALATYLAGDIGRGEWLAARGFAFCRLDVRGTRADPGHAPRRRRHTLRSNAALRQLSTNRSQPPPGSLCVPYLRP